MKFLQNSSSKQTEVAALIVPNANASTELLANVEREYRRSLVMLCLSLIRNNEVSEDVRAMLEANYGQLRILFD